MEKSKKYRSKSFGTRLNAMTQQRLEAALAVLNTNANAFIVEAVTEKLDRLEREQQASADRVLDYLSSTIQT